MCPTSARTRKFIPGIESGGTVVRTAPKTGVAHRGKLRWLGKPCSTNSPKVNPTWSGGFQSPPYLGLVKKSPLQVGLIINVMMIEGI